VARKTADAAARSCWTLRLAIALLVLGNGLEPDRIHALVLVLKSGIRISMGNRSSNYRQSGNHHHAGGDDERPARRSDQRVGCAVGAGLGAQPHRHRGNQDAQRDTAEDRDQGPSHGNRGPLDSRLLLFVREALRADDALGPSGASITARTFGTTSSSLKQMTKTRTPAARNA
jgi:hypothetical protein